jgi:hypothetical protein
MKILLLSTLCPIFLLACVSCRHDASTVKHPTITVTPAETDEILANPGMGWQTFHLTRKEDKNLPSWIPSTVCYSRWSWSEVEPNPGRLDTVFIDDAIQKARECGQKTAFRIKACSPNIGKPFHPAWLKQAGGKELMVDYNGSGPVFPIPDFDDPATLAIHLDLIRRLGERYDGHPDIDHVDLGSIGWWGEWHLTRSRIARMPTPENRMKVVKAYQNAFRKTPLVMLIDAGECTTYATRHGAGWRADSLGDLGSFDPKWNHMLNKYPDLVRDNGLLDVWKTAPVAFEPPRNVDEFVEKKWPLRWIFNYGLALHGSQFNGKSAKIPDDKHFRDELERFLRRLGYRFVIKEFSHPAHATRGACLSISTKWQNTGSAPCYQPCRVAYRLGGSNGYQKTLVSRITVNHWLPGSIELFTGDFFKQPADLPPGRIHTVDDTLVLPDDIPPGEYEVGVGVVGTNTEEPVVQLGITGRTPDGWYPISKLVIDPKGL